MSFGSRVEGCRERSCRSFCLNNFSFIWDECQTTQLLGHVAIVCLVLLVTAKLFSRAPAPCTSLPATCVVHFLVFSHGNLGDAAFSLFYFSRSGNYRGSPCGLNFYILVSRAAGHFPGVTCRLHGLVGERSVRDFGPLSGRT